MIESNDRMAPMPNVLAVEDEIRASRNALPAGVAYAEAAAARFRAYLDSKGLGQWTVFGGDSFHRLGGVGRYLGQIGESEATWEDGAELTLGGHQATEIILRPRSDEVRTLPSGFLMLPGHKCAVACFQSFSMRHGAWQALFLFAAPSPEHYRRLLDELEKCRSDADESTWEVVGSVPWKSGVRIRRERCDLDDLFLREQTKQSLVEAAKFLGEPVRQMYGDLRIPHKRGYLFYGPPGCGKTSACRILASSNSRVPALLLRPGANFDNDDLESVFERLWTRKKAMLFIEDIDALFTGSRISLSNFLNLLDGGPEWSTGDDRSVMFVATTNFPEELSAALSNRPGRFDVTVEFSCPDRPLRERFFLQRLADLPEEALEKAAARTRGMSFSHLQEIVTFSGLLAIQGGRSLRTAEDLRQAVNVVVSRDRNAVRGFPAATSPGEAFGFASGQEGAG